MAHSGRARPAIAAAATAIESFDVCVETMRQLRQRLDGHAVIRQQFRCGAMPFDVREPIVLDDTESRREQRIGTGFQLRLDDVRQLLGATQRFVEFRAGVADLLEPAAGEAVDVLVLVARQVLEFDERRLLHQLVGDGHAHLRAAALDRQGGSARGRRRHRR
jgi:hypothetical protein